MRRRSRIEVGLFLGGMLAVALFAPLSQRGDVPALRAQEESACVTALDRIVAPERLQRGETLDVTMTLQVDCGNLELPLHTVFVLDASGSMAGEPLKDMQEAVLRVMEALDPRPGAGRRLGLVAYNDEVSQTCELGEDPDALRACLEAIEPQGGTDIAAAILRGVKMFNVGRRDVADPELLREVMILLSDGANGAGCEPVQQVAGQAKGQGILLITIGIGDEVDIACLRSVASSPRYFYETVSEGLPEAFEIVLGWLRRGPLWELRVEDRLPPALRYVHGSAVPAPDELGPDGALVWRPEGEPYEGITISFRAEAVQAGRVPSSLGARLLFKDPLRRDASADFPIRQILIEESAPPPPLPELRAEIGLEEAALAIGERSAGSLELAIDLPEPTGATHLMFVLDASGSMSGEANRVLKDAVGEMLDTLGPDVDPLFQAGVVSFNSLGKLLCDLSNQISRIRSCVNRVGASGGTSIDSGLRAGHEALQQGRPAPGQEDLVLFTDGANNSGCGTVQAEADRIKAEGIVLHTVCLGSACDKDCMRRAATSPDHYYEVELDGLEPAFVDMAEELLSLRAVEAMELRLELPPSLVLDPARLSRQPDELTPRSAVWRPARLDGSVFDVDFEVEAVAAGDGAPSLGAELVFATGQRAEPAATAPPVTVIDPHATPTEPPSSPAPDTPTPPTEPTPTPAPSVEPERLYLPLLLAETCLGAPPLDLVIALDSSLSMAERGPDGVAKRDAAAEAILRLLEDLGPAPVRAGLVSFDAEARVLAELGADEAAIRAALESLELGSGTAMGAGLTEAHALLDAAPGEGRPAGRRTILLIGDGRPFPEPPEAAVAAARTAKSDGIEIFAIGLGDAVDARLFAEIASREDELRVAEGREALLRVVRWLGRRLRCGTDTWAGRALERGPSGG